MSLPNYENVGKSNIWLTLIYSYIPSLPHLPSSLITHHPVLLISPKLSKMFILFETFKQIALSVEGREKGFTVKRETKRVKWKGGWGWGNVTSKGKFPIWFSSERIL